MKNKKDSYMGDVGIIRKIDDIPELKEKLIEAFDAKAEDHKAISRYGLWLISLKAPKICQKKTKWLLTKKIMWRIIPCREASFSPISW